MKKGIGRYSSTGVKAFRGRAAAAPLKLVLADDPAENDVMVIRGRVQNGVLVLEDHVSLPEGTEVTVVVRAAPDPVGDTMSADQRTRYLRALERIDAIPDENPGDTFSGADHDRVLYGEAP